jgi:hypothetical protein
VSSRLLLVLVAAQAISLAQIDRSPVPFPGGGSGGPWGAPRLPFPVPGRGGQGRTTPEETTTRTSGKLQKIDDKSLVVEAPDGRTLEFSRSGATKFYRDSKEISASDLKAGDQVTVESTQDQRGRLFARSVFLEPPQPTAPEETASTKPTAEPPRDPDDPGPPVLKRGVPEKRPAQPAGEAAEPAPEEAPPAHEDPYIEKARAAALTFSEGLPNYVCKEVMSRFASTSRPVDWRAQDIVSMEVVYENGKESYRNLAVNDKPTSKKIDELGGAWSTGEFATTLLDLLSPSTAAEFRFRGQSAVAGTQGRIYDFTVRQPQSHWHVQAASQSIYPAYKGSVWIEPASGRALRIEMQAAFLPTAFPFDTVESVVEYAKVRIGSREFLLPAHAESLMCQRGTPNCSRNTIDFRNYHKYEAETNIDYSATKPN